MQFREKFFFEVATSSHFHKDNSPSIQRYAGKAKYMVIHIGILTGYGVGWGCDRFIGGGWEEGGGSASLLHKTWHSENVLDGTDIVLLTPILYTKYKVKERLPLE